MLRPFRSARATGTIVAASLLIATPAVVVPTLGAHNIGPMAGVFAQAAGQPTITKTKWLSDRHVAIWINSPAMKCVRQVQLLLPPTFKSNPRLSYPALYLLDGMRAATSYSGWTKYTDIIQTVDKAEFITVLPIGGAASFYTNWEKSPEPKNAMQWEKFLTVELPNVLRNHWRVNKSAGVAGLSMGGTAAVNLAERHPSLYRFVGSYSGYLDTSSDGMGEAIDQAMREVKPKYHATQMWGKYQSANWRAHDPKLHVDRLSGKSIYISAGSGNTGPYDKPSQVEGIPENTAAYTLEILSHLTSKTFVSAAEQANVRMTVKFRPSGTHSWPYWQFEFKQSLPQIAKALGLPTVGTTPGNIQYNDSLSSYAKHGDSTAQSAQSAQPAKSGKATPTRKPYHAPAKVAAELNKRNPNKPIPYKTPKNNSKCKTVGDIKKYLKGYPAIAKAAGHCQTDEYAVPGGRAQNFEHGRIFWSPGTGAVLVKGKVDEAYKKMGSSGSVLGLPVDEEHKTHDKRGYYQDFQGGRLYWSFRNGAHWVRGTILDKYRQMGYTSGKLGWPTSNEKATKKGAVSSFEHGRIEWTAKNNTAKYYKK